MIKLEWNVLLPDKDNFFFNVFDSVKFCEYLMNLSYEASKGKVTNFEEAIREGLFYSFGGKSEYEILAASLFGDITHKIDIYSQVMSNFKHFFTYIIKNWESIPRKSYNNRRN